MRAILLAALSSVAFATGAVAFATTASAQYAEGGARYGVYGDQRPTYLRPVDADESDEAIAPGEKYPPPRRAPREDEEDWRRPRRAEPEVIEREHVVRQPPQIIERERIVRQPPDVIVRER